MSSWMCSALLAGLMPQLTMGTDAKAAAYGVGTSVTSEQIAALDITILPDGRGLPVGKGSVQRGMTVYAANCARCHGPDGEGSKDYPRLVGGRGTLSAGEPILTVGSYWPYATTVWDYVRRAMPYDRPGSLSPDDIYAVVAYLLFRNGIVREDATLDERTLPEVMMPNRNGFDPDPRPDLRCTRQGELHAGHRPVTLSRLWRSAPKKMQCQRRFAAPAAPLKP